jgi:hypothetical protein
MYSKFESMVWELFESEQYIYDALAYTRNTVEAAEVLFPDEMAILKGAIPIIERADRKMIDLISKALAGTSAAAEADTLRIRRTQMKEEPRKYLRLGVGESGKVVFPPSVSNPEMLVTEGHKLWVELISISNFFDNVGVGDLPEGLEEEALSIYDLCENADNIVRSVMRMVVSRYSPYAPGKE